MQETLLVVQCNILSQDLCKRCFACRMRTSSACIAALLARCEPNPCTMFNVLKFV